MPSDTVFDPAAILKSLDEHGVQYVLIGGLAARAHGGTRPTTDIDCVAERNDDNLERLATVLRELNARLRVGGMTDEEARQLPVIIDSTTLKKFGNSTWMTDEGALDILANLRDNQGADVLYGDLNRRGDNHEIAGVVVRVASLDDIIASKEFAGREKDHVALPELRQLRRHSGDPD